MNKGYLNGVVFLDQKIAFDCVDHSILLRKLELYGIKGVLYLIKHSYSFIIQYLNNPRWRTNRAKTLEVLLRNPSFCCMPIYGMQLSYSLKFVSVGGGGGGGGETCGRSRGTSIITISIIINFESCARFLPWFSSSKYRKNVDISPKIYIIERLRKIHRGR
jgi:hypothetical protein